MKERIKTGRKKTHAGRRIARGKKKKINPGDATGRESSKVENA